MCESKENNWKCCREVVDKLPTETNEQGYQSQQIFLGYIPPDVQNSLLIGAILNWRLYSYKINSINYAKLLSFSL